MKIDIRIQYHSSSIAYFVSDVDVLYLFVLFCAFVCCACLLFLMVVFVSERLSVRLTVVLVSVSDFADLCLFLSLCFCLLCLFFCF